MKFYECPVKSYVYLSVNFNGFLDFDKERAIEKLAKSFGGEHFGSGTCISGCTRDIDFAFRKEEEATAFYKDARKRKMINEKYYASKHVCDWREAKIALIPVKKNAKKRA